MLDSNLIRYRHKGYTLEIDKEAHPLKGEVIQTFQGVILLHDQEIEDIDMVGTFAEVMEQGMKQVDRIIELSKVKFTPIQIEHLEYCIKSEQPVHSKFIMNKLARYGIIKMHEHTGQNVRLLNGGIVKAWYVREVYSTIVDGYKFHWKYYSGIFYPYVQVTKAK